MNESAENAMPHLTENLTAESLLMWIKLGKLVLEPCTRFCEYRKLALLYSSLQTAVQYSHDITQYLVTVGPYLFHN